MDLVDLLLEGVTLLLELYLLLLEAEIGVGDGLDLCIENRKYEDPLGYCEPCA